MDNQSNTPSVRKNFIYNLLYHFAVILVPIVSTPYVSRVLGADSIGIYSYATALVVYFSSAAIFGSGSYGQRTIAYYRENKEELSKSFWNVVSFRIISSTIALICYILMLELFEGISYVKVIAGLNIINVAIDITWFFQGLEIFKKTILRSLFIKVVGVIAIFIFVKSPKDIEVYTLIMVGSIIIGNLILWGFVKQLIYKPKRNITPFFGLKEMFLLFLPTVATQIYTILDKTMIKWITGSEYQIGCYEQSETVARQILTIVTSVAIVVLPRVANLYHSEKMEEAKEYVYKTYHVLWIFSLPIVVGMFGVADRFIPIFLGDGFDLSIPLFRIFAFLVVFVGCAYITGYTYLIPTKQQNIYTFSVSLAAGINFLSNLLLIPRFGAIGAAIASITAECIAAFIQIGYCFKTRQLCFNSVFSPFFKCFFASILMYGEIVLINPILSNNLVGLIEMIIISAAFYFVVLLLFRDCLLIQYSKKIVHYYRSLVRRKK